MRLTLKTLLGVAAICCATQSVAQVTFYEGEGLRGRAFRVDKTISNFEPFGFNDRARSAVVDGGRWEVCEDARFEGRCTVLRRGSYESLSGMGMDKRISSARPVNRAAYENEAPPPVAAEPAYEYRQRPNERLYQAPVTWVHAVVGPPEQRCWVEHERVSDANVPGAIAGAIIGGVLGHQVGGGRGRDVATAGGAVAGAAIGANAGGGSYGYGQNVQRCSTVPSGRPDYWDVTYNFRGVEHRVQMSAPPGPTVTVNGNGEPRG